MTAAVGRRRLLSGAVLGTAGAAAAFGADAAPKRDGGLRAYDLRDFGARGDGAADDTPAFRRLHAELRRRQRDDDARRASDPAWPEPAHLVVIPPGLYRTMWNRWTWGVRRVTVFGYGAALQCTHPGPFDADQATFAGNRDHYWTWAPDAPTYSVNPPQDFGRRLATARAGDTRLTLIEAAEPGLFRPGAWVLVQSYAQQHHGYPPNARYFDRARALAVEGRTVELDRPLLHTHRDDWPEDPARPDAPSRARLVAIDRPDCPFALQHIFLGLTALSNPNHTDRNPDSRATKEAFGLYGVLDATVRDCTLIALGVSQAGRVSVEHCDIAYTEPDKIVDEVLFDRCVIGQLRQCTGVNRVVARDTTFLQNAQFLSREAIVERCTFPGLATGSRYGGIDLRGPWPTRFMRVAECRFLGDGNPDHGAFAGEVWTDVPLDGVRMAVLAHDRFGARAGTDEFNQLLCILEEDFPLRVLDHQGDWPARCIAIRGGVGRIEVSIDCQRPLHGATALRIPRLDRLVVTGCDFRNVRQTPISVPSLRWD